MTATSSKVETQIWEQNPDKPGYLRVARTKTVQEVYEEIRVILGEYPDGAEEYFMVSAGGQPANGLWPQGRLVVFPVTGGSEGHYIHVEVHGGGGVADLPDTARKLMFMGKTFMGWDAAWAFAKQLAEILDV